MILLGAAALSGPQDLLGSSQGAQPRTIMPADPARAAVVAGLAGLIRDSHLVLAVHDRGPSPYVELVLWLKDQRDPGVLNADELVLLCHSQIMRTITTYTLSSERLDRTSSLTAASAIDLAEASSRGFCDRWRSEPAVEARVLADGISDLRIGEKRQNVEMSKRPNVQTDGPHPFWTCGRLDVWTFVITLTWPSDSADSHEEDASVVVDAWRVR